MKTLLTVLIAFALSATLVAQVPGHDKESKASDEITISSPLLIGGQTVAPGKYKVACNGNEVTFTRVADGEKVLTLPCKGKDLGKKAENTEIHTSLNASGTRVVDKLLLRGSNVEHVF